MGFLLNAYLSGLAVLSTLTGGGGVATPVAGTFESCQTYTHVCIDYHGYGVTQFIPGEGHTEQLLNVNQGTAGSWVFEVVGSDADGMPIYRVFVADTDGSVQPNPNGDY